MSFPKIEGYVVTEKLGSGSYSTVYKAYTKVGARCIVAIKCVDKARVKHSGTAIDNLITEIRLLKTLTHPHIVHMKHFTWDDRNIYIIMEYCCGGDLSKYIHKYGRVPEKRVLYFLQQLASALKFLREKGVVHMDLKPHNMLLHKGSDGKYVLKVADFGLFSAVTCWVAETLRKRGMRILVYLDDFLLVHQDPSKLALQAAEAVELLKALGWKVNHLKSVLTPVRSLDFLGIKWDTEKNLMLLPPKKQMSISIALTGVIMYECLFGKAPYSSATFKELVDKIQRRAPIEIPPNSSISAGCLDLLTRLLQHDPDKRISYEEFFSHEYMDLDHMPSKENYNKAVVLIKHAIELDCSGRLTEALEAYGESLRYLVPAVGVETDADRRSALAAKLTRYMERAEEIKRIVRGQSSPSADGARVQPTHAHAHAQHSYGCNGADVQSVSTISVEDVPETNGKVELVESKNKKEKPRGALARLLRRPVPYLSDKDSSITDGDKTQKPDETNELCRIT